MAPHARALARVELGVGIFAFCCAILAYAPVAGSIAERVGYPGDLEWMEGATLVTAERIREGLPIYGTPSPDYIPFIYPPLYAALIAGLSFVFPLGYPLGRSLSIVCIVAAAAALVYGARRERASWPLALSAVGLLAVTWEDSGTFFDLVRTDSLSLALIGWSLMLGNGPTARHTIASGILLALAFTAKQHAALLGIPMGLWIWRTYGRQRAVQFAAASAGPALAWSAVMIVATNGAYWTWIARIATEHGIVDKRFFPGSQIECWEALPLTTTAILLLPFWIWRRSYWGANTLVVLLIVSLMRGHTGGYLNVLMPMMWLQALLPFVAINAAGEWWEAKVQPGEPAAVWRSILPSVLRIGFGFLIAAQLFTAQFSVGTLWEQLSREKGVSSAFKASSTGYGRFVPTGKEHENMRALVAEIAALPGPVLIPHAPWYARMAGKETSFALITLWDIDHEGGVFDGQVETIDGAIADGYFKSAVVPDEKLGHGLKEYFRKSGSIHTRGVGPKTGWPVKLRQVWTHESVEAEPPTGR